MNQNRVSWIRAISIAACLMTSSSAFALWLATSDKHYFAFYSALFLLLGVSEFRGLVREVNAWHFNVTPHAFQRLPKGSWVVMNAGICRHMPHDSAVYVTIADVPTCDRALATLRLSSEWIDIRDYKRILDGNQPREISIGDRIAFTWE